MPTEWTCTEEASSTHCVVIATSTQPTGAYTGPNFQEWLFVCMVFLFIISFSLWPRIFKPIKSLSE